MKFKNILLVGVIFLSTIITESQGNSVSRSTSITKSSGIYGYRSAVRKTYRSVGPYGTRTTVLKTYKTAGPFGSHTYKSRATRTVGPYGSSVALQRGSSTTTPFGGTHSYRGYSSSNNHSFYTPNYGSCYYSGIGCRWYGSPYFYNPRPFYY